TPPRVGEEERAPSRPSARPRCGAAGAERDRLAHAAWNEYDACAPSGCLRVRGILLGRSPRILRLQTVFRILTSAHSCRIRGEKHRPVPGIRTSLPLLPPPPALPGVRKCAADTHSAQCAGRRGWLRNRYFEERSGPGRTGPDLGS